MCKGGLIEKKNMAEWTRSYRAWAINPSRFHQDVFAKPCQRMQLPVKATIFWLVAISPRSKYYGKLAEREGLDPPWPFGLLFSRQAHLPILPSLHKLDHQTGFAPSLWGFADLRICYSAIDGFKINIHIHHNLLATPVGIEPAFSHRKWLVLTIIRWGHLFWYFYFEK